jgi:hypothetical protein
MPGPKPSTELNLSGKIKRYNALKARIAGVEEEVRAKVARKSEKLADQLTELRDLINEELGDDLSAPNNGRGDAVRQDEMHASEA